MVIALGIIAVLLLLALVGIKKPAKQTEEERQHEVDLMLYQPPIIEGETVQTRKDDDPPILI